MKITRVAFVNYRKHVSLNLELTGSLIGLTGRNGSGKSRLLMGIRDCLTGEFSPTKEKCVTWGAKSGSLEIDVQLSIGRIMTVHRDIPSGKAWLRFSDSPPGTPDTVGAAKVNETILQTLGTEKSILQHIVFVGQREIEALLFDRTGVKARLAQRFFGLDKAQVLEKSIGVEMGKIAFDSLDQQIPALSAEINAHRQTIEKHQQSLFQLGEQVTDAEIAAVEARWRSATELMNKEAGLKALNIASEDLQRQIAAGVAQNDANAAQLAQVRVEDLDRLYGYHLQVQQQQASQRSLLDSIARMEQAVAAAGAEPVTQAEVDRLFDVRRGIDGQVELLQAQIRQERLELNNTISTPNCPRCGQAVDLSHRAHMEAQVIEKEGRVAVIIRDQQNPAVAASQAAQADRSNWLRRIGNAPSQIEVMRSQLAALGEVPTILPEPQKFLDARRQIDAMTAQLAESRRTIEAAQAKLQENQRQQEAFRASLAAGTQGEDTQALVRTLDGLRSRQAAQRQWQAEISHVNQLMQRAQSQLELARSAAIENQVNAEFSKALGRMRETFHPDGAPKVLVSRTVQRLEDGVNRYLEMLETPFRAKAREGLDFDYIFQHGLGDSDDLSVGQQVDVAWAFRLSAMQSLGASVGMMTMDEPTAPLDKQTKQHFHVLLDHLRQLAAAGQMQFIVATHDEDLVAFCDQHIQL